MVDLTRPYDEASVTGVPINPDSNNPIEVSQTSYIQTLYDAVPPAPDGVGPNGPISLTRWRRSAPKAPAQYQFRRRAEFGGRGLDRRRCQPRRHQYRRLPVRWRTLAALSAAGYRRRRAGAGG